MCIGDVCVACWKHVCVFLLWVCCQGACGSLQEISHYTPSLIVAGTDKSRNTYKHAQTHTHTHKYINSHHSLIMETYQMYVCCGALYRLHPKQITPLRLRILPLNLLKPSPVFCPPPPSALLLPAYSSSSSLHPFFVQLNIAGDWQPISWRWKSFRSLNSALKHANLMKISSFFF